jgi:ribose 5-phosphate isomerase B
MRAVITERDIPASGEFKIASGAIVTPSARDLAAQRGVKLVEVPADQLTSGGPPDRTIAIGADHGGYRMKEALKAIIGELQLGFQDIGVFEEKPADYPDIAEKVGQLVAEGKASRGVIVDGAGIGSAMAAIKIPGIRAALCYDRASARNSREHNDSNVLTLGGRLLTQSQADDVLRVWLTTPFAGGRHAARVEKITALEQRYANWTPRR